MRRDLLEYLDPADLAAATELDQGELELGAGFAPHLPHADWPPAWTIPPDLYNVQRWGGIQNAQATNDFLPLVRVELPYREARLWDINFLTPIRASGAVTMGRTFIASNANPDLIQPYAQGMVEISWGHGGGNARTIYCNWPAAGATWQVHGSFVSVSVQDNSTTVPINRGFAARYAANLAPASVARTLSWWNSPLGIEELGNFGGGTAATPRLVPRGAVALILQAVTSNFACTIEMRAGTSVLQTHTYVGSANRTVPDFFVPIPIPPLTNNVRFVNGGAAITGLNFVWIFDLN